MSEYAYPPINDADARARWYWDEMAHTTGAEHAIAERKYRLAMSELNNRTSPQRSSASKSSDAVEVTGALKPEGEQK